MRSSNRSSTNNFQTSFKSTNSRLGSGEFNFMLTLHALRFGSLVLQIVEVIDGVVTFALGHLALVVGFFEAGVEHGDGGLHRGDCLGGLEVCTACVAFSSTKRETFLLPSRFLLSEVGFHC